MSDYVSPAEMPIGLLTDSDWRAALERIEHEAALLPGRGDDAAGAKRAHDRVERKVQCIMRISDGDGGAAVFLVGSRNLSAGGMSLLHGTALDPETPVILALEASQGFGAIVPATVAWCRRIGMVGPGGAVVYEVGMRFDHPLRVDAHLDAA